MYLWIHLIAAVLLLLVVMFALTKKDNHITPYVITARILYVVMILDGLKILIPAISRNIPLSIVKVVFAIGLIGIIEMMFASKMKNQLNSKKVWLTLGSFVVVFILGFMLAQGRPFI
ncbi:hypothetical protein WR164_00590 [Philodulcilactobacillus myokoensis]|uniref:Uncharacterized protein n=2 Tax=Philodulcilactobacillus myokoensis TaxID=2929573 RepID=A0A9W6B003_9LACO|nr:hypothetical protein WR164_00590 [Philodulcilactobacillus myokoensis]